MAPPLPFEIEYVRSTQGDLAFFEVFVRRQILDSIDLHLTHQPTTVTTRVKRLRPNPIGRWELRIGDYRAIYDVDDTLRQVTIKVIGEKRGSQLFVQGREYHDHESD